MVVGKGVAKILCSFLILSYIQLILTSLLFTILSRSLHTSQNLSGSSHDPRSKPHSQTNSINSYSVLNGNNSSTSMDCININSLRLNDISATNSSQNIINPSQLITLAESVLNEKGPLPVGEVGKMLQEATGNAQLSQILKERHNGLKKFLEKFSDKFIMSCDHPFNPHVYLRRSYGPDEQKEIENGSTAYLDKKVKVCIITSFILFVSPLITHVSFCFIRNHAVVRIESKHGNLLMFHQHRCKAESTLKWIIFDFTSKSPISIYFLLHFEQNLSQIQYFQYFKFNWFYCYILKIRRPLIST